MVRIYQNNVITMLKESKERLISDNEMLTENIDEALHRVEIWKTKKKENENKINEIDKAIIKLESK